ncbi:MAG TPA: RNA polymerase sigma factor SigJ [Thermomicrobiales bacterium]|nr:RNA polymerase sigma factor SigJ [Thermomicrobiales bacterium]
MITEAPTSQSQQAYQGLRPYLFSVAYRMTGSASDAEDLIQDAWIRYLDAGSPAVDSLRAWLTTVISRLALDYLKSARVQREQYVGTWLPEPVLTSEALAGPAETVEQREEVSVALLLLLEKLTPEQRVVYVLREGFGLGYDEIAGHLGKSAAACRQILRRAQLRLSEQRRPALAPPAEHRALTEQFLAAFASGNAARVAALLAEDVVWEGDGGPDRLASRRPVIGRDKVSRGIAGFATKVPPEMALTIQFVDLNGAPAVVVRDHGVMDRVYALDIADGKITAVRSVLNLAKLQHLDRALAGNGPASPLHLTHLGS